MSKSFNILLPLTVISLLSVSTANTSAFQKRAMEVTEEKLRNGTITPEAAAIKLAKNKVKPSEINFDIDTLYEEAVRNRANPEDAEREAAAVAHAQYEQEQAQREQERREEKAQRDQETENRRAQENAQREQEQRDAEAKNTPSEDKSGEQVTEDMGNTHTNTNNDEPEEDEATARAKIDAQTTITDSIDLIRNRTHTMGNLYQNTLDILNRAEKILDQLNVMHSSGMGSIKQFYNIFEPLRNLQEENNRIRTQANQQKKEVTGTLNTAREVQKGYDDLMSILEKAHQAYTNFCGLSTDLTQMFKQIDEIYGAADNILQEEEQKPTFADVAQEYRKSQEAQATYSQNCGFFGVAGNAKESIFKKAYAAKMKSAHTDKGGDNDEAAEINSRWEQVKIYRRFS